MADGRPNRLLALLLLALGALGLTPSCTGPSGHGEILGSVDAAPCWQGRFDLKPDFFGTAPYRDKILFRIQKGSDIQTFADGLSLEVDDVNRVYASLGKPLAVTLPVAVRAQGVPIVPESEPGLVHLSLYLHRSCKTQTVTLHAVREVALPADGRCDAEIVAGADVDSACSRTSGGGAGTGKSRIVFTSIHTGDATAPSEGRPTPTPRPSGAVDPERTAGCFDVYLADPREANPVTLEPPPCRGHLRGKFDFLHERARPSQAFP